MSNEKVAIPELREDRIIIGTYDQLLDYFAKMLKSSAAVTRELFELQKEYLRCKKQFPSFPDEYHIIGRDQCAFEISPDYSIEKQLTRLKDQPSVTNLSGHGTPGIFGMIFYCKYVKFKGFVDNSDETLPEVEIAIRSENVLMRPDNYYERLKDNSWMKK